MIPLRKIFKARDMIMQGYSVKKISEILKMSESSVRAYTKYERSKIKKMA